MDREIKSTDELAAMGGRFYACCDGYYADCTTSSWKWIDGIGFVRLDMAGRMPAPRVEVQRIAEVASLSLSRLRPAVSLRGTQTALVQ